MTYFGWRIPCWSWCLLWLCSSQRSAQTSSWALLWTGTDWPTLTSSPALSQSTPGRSRCYSWRICSCSMSSSNWLGCCSTCSPRLCNTYRRSCQHASRILLYFLHCTRKIHLRRTCWHCSRCCLSAWRYACSNRFRIHHFSLQARTNSIIKKI